MVDKFLWIATWVSYGVNTGSYLRGNEAVDKFEEHPRRRGFWLALNIAHGVFFLVLPFIYKVIVDTRHYLSIQSCSFIEGHLNRCLFLFVTTITLYLYLLGELLACNGRASLQDFNHIERFTSCEVSKVARNIASRPLLSSSLRTFSTRCGCFT